jgi:hypothetical protein
MKSPGPGVLIWSAAGAAAAPKLLEDDVAGRPGEIWGGIGVEVHFLRNSTHPGRLLVRHSAFDALDSSSNVPVSDKGGRSTSDGLPVSPGLPHPAKAIAAGIIQKLMLRVIVLSPNYRRISVYPDLGFRGIFNCQ